VPVIIPYAIDSKDGERGRNRTYNLLIKSQLLCQLSYAPGSLLSVNYGQPNSGTPKKNFPGRRLPYQNPLFPELGH
jgi:hypothetical protein